MRFEHKREKCGRAQLVTPIWWLYVATQKMELGGRIGYRAKTRILVFWRQLATLPAGGMI